MPGEAILEGANFAVTPFGNPLAVSAIAAANPFAPLVFKVNVVELPDVTVALAEAAVSANIGLITASPITCV